MKKLLFSLFLPVLTTSISANAQTALPDLSKYQCYKIDMVGLHISEEDAFYGRGFPHVFAQPSTASKKKGTAIGIVYVKWPLVTVNGFVKILRGTNQDGWVAETTVVPLRKADGSVGGCTLSWREPGRIQFHLEPGTAVRY
ncbi:hypothetical protein CCR94_02190 [Rhodoblastus sphagnicola]|uniref:Uncharacterized protein n=1 Tax=Rhodoblastus sphagnicola TaxID=333368 RepID=A0A2S6NF32_9HYPH|nr:hypothetical protein [Rhodoblastus sphagnicola]PPQ33231.1 hypothetical protein CCR94_02190 [Rhodoblastus sphagnicola]